MNVVEVKSGSSPIVLGLPHTGTYLPKDIASRLSPIGVTLSDTDWHIDRLYADLLPDVTTVRALFHRYVIDPNRDPSGESLYPGQNTTDLVPLMDFDGQAIWNEPPTKAEIESDRIQYHAAYHHALQSELDRVKALHGFAVLYDCHSIRSYIPYLFEGILPDFNIGDNNGRTCAALITTAVAKVCKSAVGYSTVTNGRFKGGWTTRHYGKPRGGVHAIQMELAQSAYLETEVSPYKYDEQKAANVQPILGDVLSAILQITTDLKVKI